MDNGKPVSDPDRSLMHFEKFRRGCTSVNGLQMYSLISTDPAPRLAPAVGLVHGWAFWSLHGSDRFSVDC